MVKENNLTTSKYWDSIYRKFAVRSFGIRRFCWHPCGYGDQLIDRVLSCVIERYKPTTVLEIGCGNSNWLPYIAQKYNVEVYGIDYSQIGCNLLINKLEKEQNRKNIYCVDFFDEEAMRQLPRVDMIYSLGVVEHFSNTEDVISRFSSLLNAGGILLTEIPNMTGINGRLTKMYQPKVYKKHKILTGLELRQAYERNNLKIVKEGKLGRFWLGLIAWGVEPRFPFIDKTICSIAYKLIKLSDRRKNLFKVSNAAPCIYIVGKKENRHK